MAEDHRGRVRIEPGRKRVRAYLDGHLVAALSARRLPSSR